MTNEEYALKFSQKYGAPKNKNREVAVYQSCVEMAELKDQQFKEYLEKKKAEYLADRERYLKIKGLEQTAVISEVRKDTINQIINELFKED